jgi:hypothetical protein
MSRRSCDLVDEEGTVLSGFDYNLQVWVKDYICQNVGMGEEFYGLDIRTINQREKRAPGVFVYQNF